MVIGAEKRAGHTFEDVIIIFIDTQVLFDELAGFEAELPGNPVDIYVGNPGTGGNAAICAGKAIGFCENFLVVVVKQIVQLVLFYFFQLFHQVLVPGKVFMG